jgi:hypothetical protein
MRKRDIIVGAVVLLALGVIAVWTAISILHHGM